MKSIVCLIVLVCAIASSHAFDDIIKQVNSNPLSTWTAAHNPMTAMSTEQLKALMGTRITPKKGYTATEQQLLKSLVSPQNDIPSEFDSRKQWPNCIHPIRDQKHCGSCWAFAASEAVSDRFCIASKEAINVVLSPQDMVSCDQTDMGCQGGYLESAWQYVVQNGVVPDWCFPYASDTGMAPECPTSCTNNSTISLSKEKYKLTSSYKVGSWIFFWKKVEYIQKEIMSGGPVEAGFSVYRDFLAYKSGVYSYQSGELLGGHAVKIIGWGTDSATKTDYWMIANSWGEKWGEQGFFKIKRGSDECGIEDEVYSGIPNIKDVPKM